MLLQTTRALLLSQICQNETAMNFSIFHTTKVISKSKNSILKIILGFSCGHHSDKLQAFSTHCNVKSTKLIIKYTES